jgi:hypothetical protein
MDAAGTVVSMQGVVRWAEALATASSVSSVEGSTSWPVAAVLEHLAQSIEMSLDGFPVPKSRLFQVTAGAAAFAVFRARNKMSHSLTAAIPGAPALTNSTDWRPAAHRLRAAAERFSAHTGPLQPHFAYGALSRADFALAHVFHVADHQRALRWEP